MQKLNEYFGQSRAELDILEQTSTELNQGKVKLQEGKPSVLGMYKQSRHQLFRDDGNDPDDTVKK